MTNVIHKPRHFWSAGPSRVREVLRLAYLFATELSAAGAVEIIVRPVKSRRTLEQNAKLWAMLGESTKRMTVAELGDVIECMYVFGSDKGVTWSEPKGQMPEQWEAA